jgi:hypothetical protein
VFRIGTTLTAMERAAWIDQRLDDLSGRMDGGFERVDRDLRDLRAEMNSGFSDVRREIADLRGTMNRFGGGLLIAQLGMIAALIVRG